MRLDLWTSSVLDQVDEADITWSYETERMKLAILAANRMEPRPRFFIVCGDLVDAFPGIQFEPIRSVTRTPSKMSPRSDGIPISGSHGSLPPHDRSIPGTMHRKAQERDWNELFQTLDTKIPLVCVCGNHDLGNTPTATAIQVIEQSIRQHVIH